MTDRNLNIRVAFSAINNMTRPVNAARTSTAALASQIKTTQSTLKGLERNAGSFERLSAAAANTTRELAQAKSQAAAMRSEFGAASGRTEEQTAALNKQRAAISQLARAQKDEQLRLAQLRAEFYRHGVSVTSSSKATEQISQQTARYNRQLSEQQRRLNAVTNAQASYDKAKSVQGELTGAGMKGIMAGAAVLAPIGKTVKDYADFEDAMKGVAKQVNGLRDDNGQRTAQFYEMQQAIKAASEQLPLENGAIDYAALVEGGARMGVTNSDDPWEKQKSDLLNFATTAAMAAKAFELPADQLSEDMGKIAGLYKVPTTEIERLGDAINYLDDNAKSKGSEIIDVLKRVGGLADKLSYQQAAALGSTFLTLGAAPEIAASATNAMVRELSIATTQSDKFMEGLNKLGLSAEKIQKNMSKDAMGTIISVLEAVKKIPRADRTPVLTQIFGKEFGDDAEKLANNLPELYRQLQLVNGEASKGSMRRESDIDKDSVSAQWMLVKSYSKNTFSSLGETLREPLLQIMSAADSAIRSFRNWVEMNPALVGSLLKIAAVLGTVMASLGVLALTVAGVLGPLALMRLSLTTLTGGRGFGGLNLLTNLFSFNLKGLIPSLARIPASLLSWRAATATAGGALGNLWGRLALFGNGLQMTLSRGAAGAGSALFTAFTQPGAALSALWTGIRGGLGSLLTSGMGAFSTLARGAMLLISPIGLIGAAIIAAGVLIYKYWEPIKAFFSGFFSGVMLALEPLKTSFAALSPIFDGIGRAISGVWNWFTQLFEPVNTSTETLKKCTEAGQVFGEIVGAAISGVVTVILKVAEGIGWLLEKLGAIPKAADAAAAASNAMNGAMPEQGYQPKKPVMYVWDAKQKKMVAQEWTPQPSIKSDAIIKAGNAAKPAASAPNTTPIGAPLDLKGSNPTKSSGSTTAATETPRDPNKLGDIVFKNIPPPVLLAGGYREPLTTAAAQKSNALLERFKQSAGILAASVLPFTVQPAVAEMPPVTPAAAQTKAAMSAGMASTDSYNIDINIYDARNLDEEKLVARLRRELDDIERRKQQRQRSQLTDNA